MFGIRPRTQSGVSDLSFLQQVVAQNTGRVLVQEDRLIVTFADLPIRSLPTLTIDLKRDGAWLAWRRNWSRGVGQVVASYVEDDLVTINTVTVGSGTPSKRLPGIYPAANEAEAAAHSHILVGDVSRDFVEVTTGLTPHAQVLQPLRLINVSPTVPIGFPPLVVRSVQHTLGRAASQSVITARPASAAAS